jgi:peptide/nickel transport system substrate-binding protein
MEKRAFMPAPHASPGINAGRVSRRSFVRGAMVLAGGTALLTACAPTPAPPPSSQIKPPASSPAAGAPSPAGAGSGAPTIIVPPSPSPAASPSPSPVARAGNPASPAAIASVAVNRPAGTPRPGGTLVMARTADATDFDPQLTSSLSRQRITMLTYNNLVRLSNNLAIQPDLAEAWKVSPDGKQIDFTLRKGVIWHPPVSRELVADDVRFSYERLLRDSPGRADFAIVDGVEVLDKYHVRFLLNTASAGVLASIADSRWGAIVNRETVEQHGDLRRVAVGTGPFVLEAWQRDQEMRLKRNPSYFEKGKPYIDTLVLRVVQDEASIVAGLRDGSIHHAMLEDNRHVDALQRVQSLAVHRTARIGYDSCNFNQARAPFDKPEVIQAINYAVDRDECIRASTTGFAVQTAPATPPMKQWLLTGDQWKPYYTVNLDKARALLAKAGYPNGFEATALTIPSLPTMFTNAQVVQANLRRIGINLKVESVEYAQWLQRWQKKEFEATLNTSAGYADPDTAFYRAFHSKGQNWNNLNSPELDRLLDDGRAVFEVEKRKPIYDKVQLHLLERPGQLFLFAAEMIDVTHKSVQAFSQHPTTTLWNYQHIWLGD